MKSAFNFFLLSTLTLLSACVYNHKVETKSSYYKLDNSFSADSVLLFDISPYRLKINKEMNTIITVIDNDLYKEQPVSNLGNWAADAIADWAASKSYHFDFVVLNYGGLRLESIGKGPITKGKIFELMPFDNSIVIVELDGVSLTDLFNHIIQKGGWPVSKELSLSWSKSTSELKSKISDLKIIPDKIYQVLTLDYLANGGDNCNFLKNKKRRETGVLLRTAMVEQLEYQYKNGIKKNIEKDNRIIISP